MSVSKRPTFLEKFPHFILKSVTSVGAASTRRRSQKGDGCLRDGALRAAALRGRVDDLGRRPARAPHARTRISRKFAWLGSKCTTPTFSQCFLALSPADPTWRAASQHFTRMANFMAQPRCHLPRPLGLK